MQERREFIDRYTAFEYHEVQPEVDYDRTNGLLEEIRGVVATLDRSEEARRSIVSEEPPVHEPRRPLEAAAPLSRGPAADEEAPSTDPVEEAPSTDPAEEEQPAQPREDEPLVIVAMEE